MELAEVEVGVLREPFDPFIFRQSLKHEMESTEAGRTGVHFPMFVMFWGSGSGERVG